MMNHRHIRGFTALLMWLAALAAGCAGQRPPLPAYSEFVNVRRQMTPASVLEIYGRFTATSSGRSAKASFNLLLEPGQRAYLEIVDPSQQQTYAFSLNRQQMTLLWSKDREYIREDATPQNLQAVTGFPVSADDLMLLLAGFGLNFPEWKEAGSGKDGWTLERAPFTAQMQLKSEISRIRIASPTSPEVQIEYSDYRMTNDRLIPHGIAMSVDARRIRLRLQIDRFLPRDEPATPDLFEVQLPAGAKLLQLRDIYNGRPLIY